MESFKLDAPKKEMNLKEQMEDVEIRIELIRNWMRKQADIILESEEKINEKISGKVFVESVGTTLDVEKGNFDYHYNPMAVQMRERGHHINSHTRSMIFEYLASTLPLNSSILNIGAGGDHIMVKGLQRAGHRVINTDFSQEVVNILMARTGNPGFACDLVHLDLVWPQNGIDIITGNSVLGYLDPKKVKTAADKIAKIMDKGGLFTFDMSPHPNYFSIISDREEQTVVNNMEMDPAVLMENINKFGAEKGVQISRIESSIKAHSLKCAMIGIWQKIFSDYGFKTRISMTNTQAGLLAVLRVAKHDTQVLQPVPEEKIYHDIDAMWEDNLMMQRATFTCIDSIYGPQIAKALDIPFDPRRICERVSFEIDDMTSEDINSSIGYLQPTHLIAKIMPFINGEKSIVIPQIKDLKMLQEQVFNKQNLLAIINAPNYVIPKSDSEKRKDRNKKKKMKKNR